jgi:hypothetical protein
MVHDNIFVHISCIFFNPKNHVVYPNIHYPVLKMPSLCPVLSQLSLFYNITSYATYSMLTHTNILELSFFPDFRPKFNQFLHVYYMSLIIFPSWLRPKNNNNILLRLKIVDFLITNLSSKDLRRTERKL